MKLWQKTESADKLIERFTIGKDAVLDLLIAPYDILGTLAHVTMLTRVGFINSDELPQLKKELIQLYQRAVNGELEIEEGVEDIHSQVEMMLTEKLGDIGKKVHTGRSRNDQVLVDLKMFSRARIEQLAIQVKSLFDLLIQLSEDHKDQLIPGYTHMQIAMPSSFGLWFGAYAESLADDLVSLRGGYELANRNPLGSAAGYGSSFPLDREYTTQLLGFEGLNNNVVYAQMTRGKSERVTAQGMANIAATLGKLAMDICLYMGQNFGFLTFPSNLTTGSSIMPHKKNPDVFELIRAKCNALQQLPNNINSILINLPSGYHRDLQVIKEDYLEAFDTLTDCLALTQYMLEHVEIRSSVLEDSRYQYVFSVEAVNELVQEGKTFRDAYHQVAAKINEGDFKFTGELNHTALGSLGNLNNDYTVEYMDKVLKSYNFQYVNDCLDQLIKP